MVHGLSRERRHLQPRHGGHVQNRTAPPLAHASGVQHAIRREQQAIDVRVRHRHDIPDGEVGKGSGRAEGEAGVVDENVDGAERADGARDGGVELRVVGDVGGSSEDAAGGGGGGADGVGEAGELVVRAGEEDEVGVFAGEAGGDGGADAYGGAGDEDGVVGEGHCGGRSRDFSFFGWAVLQA